MLIKGYGLTETTGAAFRMAGSEESLRWGSVGRLMGNCEAKIVDPETGVALPPGKQGELWIRGPIIMKGDTSLAFVLNNLAEKSLVYLLVWIIE